MVLEARSAGQNNTRPDRQRQKELQHRDVERHGRNRQEPLTGGQRAALIKLRSGELFFASFARDVTQMHPNPEGERPPRHVSSVFGAVSYDDGRSWPVRRWITDVAPGEPSHQEITLDSGEIRMSETTGEPLGYLSVCQSPDGVIHLISSINHYAFNLPWLEAAQAESPQQPKPKNLPVRAQLELGYEAGPRPDRAKPAWEYLGDAALLENLPAHSPGAFKIPARSGGYWTNERLNGFQQWNTATGFTIETRVQLSGKVAGPEGFLVDARARGGTMTVNQYRLSITPTAVHYYYDFEWKKIAGRLDNSGSMHTFRLSVRKYTAVQIYRDSRLLATMPSHLIIDWRQPARGSWVQWGTGDSHANARVAYVHYTTDKAYAPTK
jgi:hypothetical protein